MLRNSQHPMPRFTRPTKASISSVVTPGATILPAAVKIFLKWSFEMQYRSSLQRYRKITMTIQKEGVAVIKKRAMSCQISRVLWSLPNTTTTRHRQTKTHTVLSSQFAKGSQCPGCCKRQKIKTNKATDKKTKTISPSQLARVSYSLNALKGKDKKDKGESSYWEKETSTWPACKSLSFSGCSPPLSPPDVSGTGVGGQCWQF